MSEKIDYETFLPARKDREYYVMAYSGTSYIKHEVLLNTGELVFDVIVCEFKCIVDRIVHEEGGRYLGIGVTHG
jgi:hypothetical protein